MQRANVTMRIADVSIDLNLAYEILLRQGVLVDGNLSPKKEFPFVDFPIRLKDYINEILRPSNYTFLLCDGSAIQVGYDDKNQGDVVVSHKLTFFFSPLSLPKFRFYLCDDRGIPTLGTAKDDIINGLAEFYTLFKNVINPNLLGFCAPVGLGDNELIELWQDLTWVHGIRFDYNPAQNSASHPASHATLFDRDCRIAVAHFLDVRRFLLMVFRHLWPFCPSIADQIAQSITNRFHQAQLLPDGYQNSHGLFFGL
jgi:hypothetical protein